jgi:hypothetical protein
VVKEAALSNSIFYQANKISNSLSDKLGSNESKYRPYFPWMKRVQSVLTTCKINEQLIKLEQPETANAFLLFKGICIFDI